jgi:hypothetical protein
MAALETTVKRIAVDPTNLVEATAGNEDFT